MKAAPLPPPMSDATKRVCRMLDRICEDAHWLHAQTQLDERGVAPAFGIDTTDSQHREWLADLAADLLILKHRAMCVGDFAPGGREHDPRGPKR
jgi:hypothetical protein